MRGVFFTLAVLLLFGVILGWWSLAQSAAAQSDAATRLAAARKVGYAWQDLAEDVDRVLDVQIIQEGTNLTVLDFLPSNFSINEYLKAYGRLVAQRLPRDLNATWLDAAGNPIPLENIDDKIVVSPFSINYTWEDQGKDEVEIVCPRANCSVITGFNLAYNLSNATFQFPPDQNNSNNWNWSPDKLKDCPARQSCTNFTLRIQDSIGQVYSCPGPICAYSQFPFDEKSTLDVKAAPCNLKIDLGENAGGGPGEEIELLELKLHDAGGSACNMTLNSSTKFVFNQTPYWANIAAKLEVLENSQNASKREFISAT